MSCLYGNLSPRGRTSKELYRKECGALLVAARDAEHERIAAFKKATVVHDADGTYNPITYERELSPTAIPQRGGNMAEKVVAKCRQSGCGEVIATGEYQPGHGVIKIKAGSTVTKSNLKSNMSREAFNGIRSRHSLQNGRVGHVVD